MSEELNKACMSGDLEEVERLHASGADIHAKNDWSLQWSSRNGHLEVVEYLVEVGADIHSDDDLALRWVGEYGHLEVVKYLQSVVRKEKLARLLK